MVMFLKKVCRQRRNRKALLTLNFWNFFHWILKFADCKSETVRNHHQKCFSWVFSTSFPDFRFISCRFWIPERRITIILIYNLNIWCAISNKQTIPKHEEKNKRAECYLEVLNNNVNHPKYVITKYNIFAERTWKLFFVLSITIFFLFLVVVGKEWKRNKTVTKYSDFPVYMEKDKKPSFTLSSRRQATSFSKIYPRNTQSTETHTKQ